MSQVTWTLSGRSLVIPQLSDVAPLATVSTNHGLAAPLAGVRVQVSAKQFDGDPTGWEEWGDTYTDSDGNFTIRNIKNQTNRLFRVRVMFKNDALRIYPPNDSLLKKFVDCAIGLIPGGIIMDTVIPRDETFLEASLRGSPLLLMSKRPPPLSRVFDQLASDVMDRIEPPGEKKEEDDVPIPLLV